MLGVLFFAVLLLGVAAWGVDVFHGFGEVFYRCGAYVREFGECRGDCVGYLFLPGYRDSRLVMTIRVGGVEVRYNVTRFELDDVYRPLWYVAKFEARGVGRVEVLSNIEVEAYLLINRGGGNRTWIIVAPYVANRTDLRPLELRLGAYGVVTACTVGKYAERGAIRDIDGWKSAKVSTGYYRSVVEGRGDAVRLEWSRSKGESAVKVAFIIVNVLGRYRSIVVGEDLRPVPRDILSKLVVGGVAVDDGVVEYVEGGYLRVGGVEYRLVPNGTVTIPGKRCVVYVRTAAGEGLNVTVRSVAGAVSGRGEVAAYCLGRLEVNYSYTKWIGPAFVRYSGVAGGNVTVDVGEVVVREVNLFYFPVAEWRGAVPMGASVRVGGVERRVESQKLEVLLGPPLWPLQRQAGGAAAVFAALLFILAVAAAATGNVKWFAVYFMVAAVMGAMELLNGLVSSAVAYAMTFAPVVAAAVALRSARNLRLMSERAVFAGVPLAVSTYALYVFGVSAPLTYWYFVSFVMGLVSLAVVSRLPGKLVLLVPTGCPWRCRSSGIGGYLDGELLALVEDRAAAYRRNLESGDLAGAVRSLYDMAIDVLRESLIKACGLNRRAASKIMRSLTDLIDCARRVGLISKEAAETLHRFRRIRNRLEHRGVTIRNMKLREEDLTRICEEVTRQLGVGERWKC